MLYYPLQDRYISLLTDFGFKRIFGTEPNKRLLLDFLNTILPAHHQIQDLTFKNTEQLGSTPIDRKAIFDIYCQAESGERFIVEIQKAKQNFFKERSVYYATFPIQEQALQGEWNFELSAVYTVGVLDFIFDDHKDDDTFLHVVELKNQNCEVFYKKLKFIYIELPKFTKTLDQLETHFDKWMYLLRHLARITDPPQPLQEDIFSELFAVAEIANFSRPEQDSYQNSLKYYRDMNNVVDTARQEGIEAGRQAGIEAGRQEGIEAGRQEGIELERLRTLERQRSLLLRLLARALGALPDRAQIQISQLPADRLDDLNEIFVEFTTLEDLAQWLDQG
jgi:predicted transposase/invertase (TIGR01784 family)